MATEVPTGPLVGVNDVMVGGDGGAVTVNESVEVSVPPGVVTLIFGVAPVPAGSGAVVMVAKFTVELSEVGPKFHAVEPVKFVPLSVASVARSPRVRVDIGIVGGGGGTPT